MEISVIIPTYRPEGYLWECLNSLERQTLDKSMFEVILVLNGPEQPYRTDIAEFIHANTPDLDIHLIYTGTTGVSNARNTGIDNASGKYITFVDDDDYISSDFLQELYDKAEAGIITLCNMQFFQDRDGAILNNRMNEIFKELSQKERVSLIEARRMFFTSCMKLIPKEMIGQRRFDTSLSIGEDCLFMFLISDKISHVNFTSTDAIYYRRVREGSAIMSFNNSTSRKMKNGLGLIFRYTSIWLKGMRRYSFYFYLTRVRGALYSIRH